MGVLISEKAKFLQCVNLKCLRYNVIKPCPKVAMQQFNGQLPPLELIGSVSCINIDRTYF